MSATVIPRPPTRKRPPRYPTDADGRLVTPHQPPDGELAWALWSEGIDPRDWPRQGEWTHEDYLRLDARKGAKGIELIDGRLRWRAMADELHNDIVFLLVSLLRGLLHPTRRGRVNFSDFALRTHGKTDRKPDVVVMLATNPVFAARGRASWRTADFAIEVVSESDPDNDYVTKRREYPMAGVREYWIIDRFRREILVLALDNGAYREVGTFTEGEVRSATIPDFAVDVADVWAAAGE